MSQSSLWSRKIKRLGDTEAEVGPEGLNHRQPWVWADSRGGAALGLFQMVTQDFQQHLTRWPSSYSISLKVSGGGPQPTSCLTAQRRGAAQGLSQENAPARGGCPGNGGSTAQRKKKGWLYKAGGHLAKSRKEENWSVVAKQTRIKSQLLHPSGCGDIRNHFTSLSLSVVIYTVETVIHCLHRITMEIK